MLTSDRRRFPLGISGSLSSGDAVAAVPLMPGISEVEEEEATVVSSGLIGATACVGDAATSRLGAGSCP